jgi:type IV secretion system protein VirD4
MTGEEAEGNPAHPLTQDDIRTEDYPSFCADLLTLHHHGNASIMIEEGDEDG